MRHRTSERGAAQPQKSREDLPRTHVTFFDDEARDILPRLGTAPLMYARWSLSRGDARSARSSRVALRNLIAQAEPSIPIADIDLILGELVSNAVRYGVDPMWVEVLAFDDRLEICTQDAGAGYDLDAMLAVAATARDERGRGLHILRTLGSHFFVHVADEGRFRVCVSVARA